MKQQTAEQRRLYEVVSHWAEVQPGVDAWRHNERRATYAEFRDQVRRFAKALLAAGLQQGDRVAVLSAPRPEHWISFIATASIGAIWIGLNPRYQMRELSYVLGDSTPRLLFGVESFEGRDFRVPLMELAAESKSIEQAVIFNQNYLDLDPVEALADARAFASRLCEGVVRYGDHPNDRDSERRMRVGLVSADFRRHPVGRFLVEPVAASSAEGIEYFAYSGRDNDDELNLRFRKLIPNWRHAGKMRDDELAEQIRRDRIDILVDLSGYTSGERLAVFARKPAPVAVTYLGYFASTGLDAIDYVLANRWLIPEEERRQWVEVPWHLPHSHLCFVEPQAPTPVVAAPRHARGQFTFGSFNNISKYSEGTLAIWAKILAAVPESRLLMRDTATSDGQRSQITDSLVGHGIAPERVVFEPRLEVYEEHLAGYGRLDLALDPFPYNGGTTTVEALYMGVPVLTLHGDRYVAHMSESILRSAGLDEWVAADRDDYVAKAVAAAEVPQHLDATRTRLRDQLRESTLFDARVFARELEAAFRGMWRAWCLKQ